MSNFGQSSLGNTKVGACGEHEDSGRGKCFMPGLIRPDRNYKEASPSKEKDEEGREGGERRENREKEKTGSVGLECCMILKHTCQSLLMRPSEPANALRFNFSCEGRREKKNTNVMRSQIKIRYFK